MSKRSKKIKKKSFGKSQFFHFFQTFDFRPQWCPYMGQENFFNTLGIIYHQYLLPLLEQKFWYFVQFCYKVRNTFWSKKPKNHILTFSQQKTSNECYHSNQSPILKFSPSNCLHFLNILPSADINHFWAMKPFIQPYPQFHHVSHIGFLPIKTCKIKNLLFWHFRHKLQLESEWKIQTWPKSNKDNTFKLTFTHLALDAFRWFSPPYIT